MFHESVRSCFVPWEFSMKSVRSEATIWSLRSSNIIGSRFAAKSESPAPLDLTDDDKTSLLRLAGHKAFLWDGVSESRALQILQLEVKEFKGRQISNTAVSLSIPMPI